MAQPFYARKIVLNVGPRKGETVYSLQPYYNGVISTESMAKQIAEESSLTAADVLGVLERAAYFCKSHMDLGYKVCFNGMGVFYNKLTTKGTVSSESEVTSKLVTSIKPFFKPEYTVVNGVFRYAMLPERVELKKFKGGVIVMEEQGDGSDITNPDDLNQGSNGSGNTTPDNGGSSSTENTNPGGGTSAGDGTGDEDMGM